jgi:hypothetical protein
MPSWLRQSTSVDIGIGPFLDDSDGKTAETALTITQPDIRLKKNGGDWAQKNAAQTLSHEEAGWYEVTLDATDTNTLGLLIVAIHETGALPVWREYMVVPANVWDAYLASDKLQVDVVEWLGTAAATPTVAGVPEVDLTHIAGAAVSTSTAQLGVNTVQAGGTAWGSGAITAASIAPDAIGASELAADAVAEIADQVWDEVLSGHLTAGSTGAALNGAGSAGDPWTTALPGAYGAGSAGHIVGNLYAHGDANWSSAGTGGGQYAQGEYLSDTSSTAASDPGAGDMRWNNATQASATALYFDDLTSLGGDASNVFASIVAGDVLTIQQKENADNLQRWIVTSAVDNTGWWTINVTLSQFDGANIANNQDVIVRLAHPQTTAGQIADAVWQETIPGAYTSGQAGKVVGDNLNATVSSRATPAEVNAEVVDALATDTYAEIGQEAPAATQTLRKMIGYLYKAFRNKIEQDSTTLKIYNDAGSVVDQKATVSDSGTLYTRGEIGTGP